jgi:cytochrome b6-f complex iron-sulfur subunit
MAKRPSVKEILEAARKGGAAQPADESSAVPEEVAGAEQVDDAGTDAVAAESAAAPPLAANIPSPATLGRPLTLKEKLAAARAGSGPQPAAAPAAKKAAAPAPAAEAGDSDAPAEAPKAVPPPAKPLGRPMTLQEKLAAARGGAAAPASPAAAVKPAGAKPAAAAAKTAAARVLPPLDKITDPKDLAEAARQASATKAKEIAAAAAAAAPAKAPAKSGPAKPNTVPPRPTRDLAGDATASSLWSVNRRGFFLGSLFVSWGVAWIIVAWVTFTAALSEMTLMCVRFMFPNVLAEPPSTIKVGLPTNYEPEEVSERFKAEWGFWIVRSTRYDGQDVIYAIQSVCTHLGCPPNWLAAEQKFKCPCHGSGFYITGINFEGPAPRPLERFKVALADDGQIMVDKSQRFQQELGQWSDPDSFIPA